MSKMMPLQILFSVMRLLSVGLKNVFEEFGNEIIELIVNYVTERFTRLTEQEIREYDPFIVKKIRDRLQEVAKYSSTID